MTSNFAIIPYDKLHPYIKTSCVPSTQMKILFWLTPILIAIAYVLLLQTPLLDIANATINIIKTTFDHTTVSQNQNPKHPFANEMSVHRAIRKVFLAVEQAEGAGARVRRSIGTPNLRNFSPFLMLDHFTVNPGAGFPDQQVYPPILGKKNKAANTPQPSSRPGDHYIRP